MRRYAHSHLGPKRAGHAKDGRETDHGPVRAAGKKQVRDEVITVPPSDSYVNFGDVSRKHLNIQCQYGVRYIKGYNGVVGFSADFPALGTGLRFMGDETNYHDLKIHKDDVAEFVRRFELYEKNRYGH